MDSCFKNVVTIGGQTHNLFVTRKDLPYPWQFQLWSFKLRGHKIQQSFMNKNEFFKRYLDIAWYGMTESLECQIFVIVIFFNCGRVLQFVAHSRYYKGALTQKRSFLVICTTFRSDFHVKTKQTFNTKFVIWNDMICTKVTKKWKINSCHF